MHGCVSGWSPLSNLWGARSSSLAQFTPSLAKGGRDRSEPPACVILAIVGESGDFVLERHSVAAKKPVIPSHKHLTLVVLCLTVALQSLYLRGQESAPLPALKLSHCVSGCPEAVNPTGLEQKHLLVRSSYTALFNPVTGTADWVAFRANAEAAGIASGKNRELQPEVDDLVSWADWQQTVDLGADYSLERYVPLIGFAGTPFWPELNLGANAVPVSAGLARGAWYGLQWALRTATIRKGELFVVTGPLFQERQLIAEPPAIPAAFFVVISTEEGVAVAFRLSQAATVSDHHCSMSTPLLSLEQESGLSFPGLSDEGDGGSLLQALGCGQIR